MIYFISGHRDITQEEFDANYVPAIEDAIDNGQTTWEDCEFIVGDCKGCDQMAAEYIAKYIEENGQEAVQQNFKRVVAVDPDVGVQHLVVYLSGGHIAQRAELAQPVAAGCDHINDEHRFKDKEQQSPQHLTPGNIAEAHHKVGYLCFPAAPCKGGGAIRQLVSDAPESACDPVPDGFDQRGQPAGDAENEQDNVVPQTLKRVQPEVFQIRQFLHDQSG